MYIFIFNLNQKVFLNFVIVINKFICFFTVADPLVGRADIDKEKISHDDANQDELFRTPINDEKTDGSGAHEMFYRIEHLFSKNVNETMAKFNQEEDDKTVNENRIIGCDMINDGKQPVIYKKAAWAIINRLMPTLNKSPHL